MSLLIVFLYMMCSTKCFNNKKYRWIYFYLCRLYSLMKLNFVRLCSLDKFSSNHHPRRYKKLSI
uniref:Uncharacterized protein n=1 Tax=Lepeophtheirus salmonis TaxID=72036 RepID=A0A0K2UGM2_LEPSM